MTNVHKTVLYNFTEIFSHKIVGFISSSFVTISEEKQAKGVTVKTLRVIQLKLNAIKAVREGMNGRQ